MKTIFKYIFYYLILLLIILYFSTIKEGIEVFQLSKSQQSFSKTMEYFFLWVIPFWWFILIIASILLAILTKGILKLGGRL